MIHTPFEKEDLRFRKLAKNGYVVAHATRDDITVASATNQRFLIRSHDGRTLAVHLPRRCRFLEPAVPLDFALRVPARRAPRYFN